MEEKNLDKCNQPEKTSISALTEAAAQELASKQKERSKKHYGGLFKDHYFRYVNKVVEVTHNHFKKFILGIFILLILFFCLGIKRADYPLALSVKAESQAISLELVEGIFWNGDTQLDSKRFRIKGTIISTNSIGGSETSKNQNKGILEVRTDENAHLHFSDITIPSGSRITLQADGNQLMKFQINLPEPPNERGLHGKLYIVGGGEICTGIAGESPECTPIRPAPHIPVAIPRSIPFSADSGEVELILASADPFQLNGLIVSEVSFWKEEITSSVTDSPFRCGIDTGQLSFSNIPETQELWGKKCIRLTSAHLDGRLYCNERLTRSRSLIETRLSGKALANESLMPRKLKIGLNSPKVIIFLQFIGLFTAVVSILEMIGKK